MHIAASFLVAALDHGFYDIRTRTDRRILGRIDPGASPDRAGVPPDRVVFSGPTILASTLPSVSGR